MSVTSLHTPDLKPKVTAQKIVTNTIGLSTAFVLRKFFTLFYFILIVRYTDTDITGLYILLVSIYTFAASFMDFGLPPVLIREASGRPDLLKRYLDNVMGLKSVLTLITVGSGLILINTLHYPPLTRNLVCMVLLMMTLESYAFVFLSVFRALHQIRYEALGMLIGQSLTISIGCLTLLGGFATRENVLYFLITALLVNQLFIFLFSAWKLKKRLHITPGFCLEKGMVKFLIIQAAPFLIVACFEKILFLDTVLLSQFAHETVIALVGPPLTIVGAFQFIPTAVEATIYPALSAFQASSTEKLTQVFERSFTALMLVIVPSVVGLYLLGENIMELGFGREYVIATPALRILAISMIFIFGMTPVASLLNACRLQGKNTILLGITSLLHLALVIILIPRYQVNGIAVASLASQAFLLAWGLKFANRILPGILKSCFTNLAKIVLAAIPMGLAVFFMKNFVHFLWTIPAGVVLYLTMLKIFNLLGDFKLGELLLGWKKNSVPQSLP